MPPTDAAGTAVVPAVAQCPCGARQRRRQHSDLSTRFHRMSHIRYPSHLNRRNARTSESRFGDFRTGDFRTGDLRSQISLVFGQFSRFCQYRLRLCQSLRRHQNRDAACGGALSWRKGSKQPGRRGFRQGPRRGWAWCRGRGQPPVGGPQQSVACLPLLLEPTQTPREDVPTCSGPRLQDACPI